MISADPDRRIGLYSPLDPNFVGGMHTWLREFWDPYLHSRNAVLRIVHTGLRPEGGKIEHQALSSRIEVLELSGSKMPGTGAKLPRTSDLIAALEDRDVVYLDNGYFLQDRAVARAVSRNGIPLISGHHSVILGDALHRAAWHLSGRWLMPQFDAVHALNESDAAYLRSLDAKNVMTIPIPIDIERFRVVPRAPGGPRRVGFLGRLHPQKGIDRLTTLVRELKRGAESDIIFRVAGDGPLRAEVAPLAAEGLLEYVGHIGAEATPAFLQSCDVICMPSRSETFGIVAAEAAACGRRVVATDLPALRTVLNPQWHLLVNEPDSVGAWEKALRAAISAPDRSQDIADDAARRFGFEPVARAFDDLLDAAIVARRTMR